MTALPSGRRESRLTSTNPPTTRRTDSRWPRPTTPTTIRRSSGASGSAAGHRPPRAPSPPPLKGYAFVNGETQETCRDISHAQLGLEAITNGAETARIQGIDLYGEQQQRIVDAYEFAAKYNTAFLTSGTKTWPLQPCGGRPGSHGGVSGDGTGGQGFHLGWEVAYNAYANRLGVPMPQTADFIAQYERPSTFKAFQHVAWEALTNAGNVPSGCTQPDLRAGQASVTVTVPEDGTYQLWSRAQPSSNGPASYLASIDGSCPITVTGTGLTGGAWSWVPQGGSGIPLTAGSHTIVLTGVTQGLTIASVLLTSDATCTPVAAGNNCDNTLAPPATDPNIPVTTLSAPSNGDQVTGPVSIQAGAMDQTPIDHIDFSVDGLKVGSSSAAPFSYSWDSSKVANGPHQLQAVAFDTAGSTGSSTITTVQVSNPDVTPPSAPANVQAVATSATSVQVTWDASTDTAAVIGYVVSRDGAAIATVGSVTSYTDTITIGSTAYSYTVTALDAAGNSSPASAPTTVTAPPPPDTTAPSSPSDVTATAASSTRIDLSWTASTRWHGRHCVRHQSRRHPARHGRCGDHVHRRDGCRVDGVQLHGRCGRRSRQCVAGVSCGPVTTPAPPDTTAPTAPTDVSALANSPTGVRLTWTAATDDVGVTGYTVSRNGTPLATLGNVTTYTDSTVQPATAYTYVVTAFDAAANTSPGSGAALVTTPPAPDVTAPSTPTSLKATATSASQVSLSWTPSSDSVGVTGYSLTRNGTFLATLGVVTAYTDTTANPSTAYTYTLTARDAAGNVSPASYPAVVTTPPAPDAISPGAISNLSATAITSYQTNLTWTAATDNVGVTGYRVSRGGTLLATTTTAAYIDQTVVPSTAYSYSIVAIDAAGNAGTAKAVSLTMPADTAAIGAGWAGSYFANTTFSGPAVTRLDPTLNFAWGTAAPIAKIPADNFSVRWTGKLKAPTTGSYTITTQADDNVKLSVNGVVLIDQSTGAAASKSAAISLVAGKSYNVRLDYVEKTNAATMKLSWAGPGIAKAIIPSSAVTSGSDGLTAAYFSNNSLSGTPTLIRPDANVNFSWGTTSPAPSLPAGNFSARWTGAVLTPTTGAYKFSRTRPMAESDCG